MLTRQEMAQERAREIHLTASQVFCERGYERASLRDLAAATGLTKAGLYYYFQSKEELLFLILDGYMDELLAGVARIAAGVRDPEERLRAFISFQTNMYCRDVHRSKLIIHEENCLSGEWYATVKGKQKEYLGYWRDALAAWATERGREIPFLSAHVMLLTGMGNWIYQWYDPKGPLGPQALAELIFGIFTRGSVPAASPPLA
ncbi:MAG: TetR/AcrR family transcriptional regulator [Deltaproteobacteria bacterium]|nr:TetR/AcrR family transcriptional regulator [Deltaproteobacteria bacterium]